MDTYRAFLAIILSFLILLGYQYFFVPQQEVAETQEQQPAAVAETAQPEIAAETPGAEAAAPSAVQTPGVAELQVVAGKDVPVETDLYSAVVTESGGGIKNFRLKKYREENTADSGPKELVKTEAAGELPLYFTWGVDPTLAKVARFATDQESVTVTGDGPEKSLTMKTELESGLILTRTMTFKPGSYLIRLAVDVHNTSENAFKGSPYLGLTNRPFSDNAQRFLFSGPAVLVDGELREFKTDDIQKEQGIVMGQIAWAAYEGNYFMNGIIPENGGGKATVRMTAVDDKVSTLLSGDQDVLMPQSHKVYDYTVYLGPKKVSILREAGLDLERVVNFGWFDKMARPLLWLMNFLYEYCRNYGVAIILVTVLIKAILWPISHRGMKSMKNMQAIQPKMAKLREKYKDDPTRLNQEMMTLYKTYKVNPLGGCLPMLLQIPVFFALYKVLLQAIELRHAPFMLWITDLSAPDRLWIGFDIPLLGGIPVLTILMGGSMFLQQKLTPSPADPTQAKIMMFLPLIFTFMFLNFASGLVLYWFVNNLLSIGQQYMVNRPVKATA